MGELAGWAKCIRFTIDHTKVPSSLVNFPVLLYISASSGIGAIDLSLVFDEVGSNSKKIAVTISDGETQCYVEIDRWDSVNEKAWLWVKVPSVSNTEDTVMYLYYDNTQDDNTTYVGDVNSAVGALVWDANFKGVWHLSEASGTLYDSTSNNNDLTAYNTPTYDIDGKIGKCLDFNSAQIENLKRASAVVTGYPLTLEVWGNLDAGSYALGVVRASSQYAAHMMIAGTTANYFVCSGPGTDTFCSTLNSISLGVWGYFVAVGHSATLRNSYLNADVANKGTSVTSRNPSSLSQTQSMILDATWGANVGPGDGRVDELRISNTDRSEAWIAASYESERDNFLLWYVTESVTVSFNTSRELLLSVRNEFCTNRKPSIVILNKYNTLRQFLTVYGGNTLRSIKTTALILGTGVRDVTKYKSYIGQTVRYFKFLIGSKTVRKLGAFNLYYSGLAERELSSAFLFFGNTYREIHRQFLGIFSTDRTVYRLFLGAFGTIRDVCSQHLDKYNTIRGLSVLTNLYGKTIRSTMEQLQHMASTLRYVGKLYVDTINRILNR